MRPPRRALLCAALAVGVLLIGPIAQSHSARAVPTIKGETLPAIAGCASPQQWASDWHPQFVGPDYTIEATYRCRDALLHVSVVQYLEQHQGKEAVGEFNSIVPRGWWNSTTRDRVTVGSLNRVNEYHVDHAVPLTIWSWYSVGLQPSVSPFGVKTLEALNALRFRAVPTTNITIAVEGGAPDAAARVLESGADTIWAWFTQRPATT